MEFMRITKENIEKEHICCAMSNSQSNRKKDWLRERFDEGLVFYRSVERGKCFIEYIPAENAWAPIDAPGYLFINCLWIAGSMKGHGYSRELLEECIREAKREGRLGLCILSTAGKKKEFLSDPKHLAHMGFAAADEAPGGITLMYLPLSADAPLPRFLPNAKKGAIDEKGFVIYYSDQCPFAYYWAARLESTAAQYGIPLKTVYIGTREDARAMCIPFTNYALFRDGEFITHAIQSDKKLLKLAGISE